MADEQDDRRTHKLQQALPSGAEMAAVVTQLQRIADALGQMAAATMPKLANMSEADRALASEKFIDAADVDARCKKALRREKICDPREITRERFLGTRECGDKTIARLIELRDKLISQLGIDK